VATLVAKPLANTGAVNAKKKYIVAGNVSSGFPLFYNQNTF